MRRYRSNVSQWVSEWVSDTVEPTWLMWPWWVKIPTEDFTYVTLTIGDTMEMMFEVAMGVMDMEDDKVADMALKIPNEANWWLNL